MIKIEPLLATDYPEICALLPHQSDFGDAESFSNARSFFFRGISFWQHWLPISLHFSSSVYVAREDGTILGMIAVRNIGKTKSCWRIEQLIVHPSHRGRGIAQELLRYIFALLGSQGVSHFIAEVSDQNSAALSLSAGFGFCRCAKLTAYEIELPTGSPISETSPFRLATPDDKQKLFQLFQEVLPPDIRSVFSYMANDYSVKKSMSTLNKNHQVIADSWYWVSEDIERKVLTSAVKVRTDDRKTYHIQFAISPGWTEQASSLVEFCLQSLRSVATPSIVTTKVYDFETYLIQALTEKKMERTGGYCLLAREHWLRAKKPLKSSKQTVRLPPITNPA